MFPRICRTPAQHITKNDTRDTNDLAIAGLGAAPVELADATPRSITSIDLARSTRSRSVSSVTLPPVQGASSPAVGRSLSGYFPWNFPGDFPDRRPFLSAQKGIGPKVPDLRGMTLRAVLEESAATGLPIDVQGDGMARTRIRRRAAYSRPEAASTCS